MDFKAKIRVVITVPFTADVAVLTKECTEEDITSIYDSRIDVAVHAEEAIVEQVRKVLADTGSIEDILVEEVIEASEKE